MTMRSFIRIVAIVLACEAVLVAIIAPSSSTHTPVFHVIIALVAISILAFEFIWRRSMAIIAIGIPIAMFGDNLLSYLKDGDPFGITHAMIGPMNWVSYSLISGAKYMATLMAVLALSWLVTKAIAQINRRAQ